MNGPFTNHASPEDDEPSAVGTLLLELAARLRDLQTGCEYGLLATQIGACGSQLACSSLLSSLEAIVQSRFKQPTPSVVFSSCAGRGLQVAVRVRGGCRGRCPSDGPAGHPLTIGSKGQYRAGRRNVKRQNGRWHAGHGEHVWWSEGWS